jgi:iron complex outermembrane receptor protein
MNNESAFELDQNFQDILPVITSASRLTESVLKSTSSVTVIDKAMIQASGFVEIADLFRLVPGFQVALVDGHTYSVTAHGNGWEFPNKLQLLIDGRSTYLPSLSAIDWSTLGVHIEDIERIEVVRGTAAPAYGSNSFAGAINIITTEPYLDDSYTIRTRFGNNNERSHLLKLSGVKGTWSYRMTGSTIDSDGFDELDDKRDLHNFNFSLLNEPNSQNKIRTNLSLNKGKTGSQDTAEGFEQVDRSIKSYSAHLNWSHLISQNEELEINAYHHFRDENDMRYSDFLSEYFSIPPAYIPYYFAGAEDQRVYLGERTSRAHRTDIEFQYTKIINPDFQYVYGMAARYDTLSSVMSFPNSGTVTDTSFRAFGTIQKSFNELFTVNIGGLFEKTRVEKSHFSPKLSVSYHLTPLQSLRTSVARAYRLPSLLEVSFDSNSQLDNGVILDRLYKSDDDIKAEQIDSYEIGYLGKHAQFPFSWEVKLYKERYSDLIGFVGDYRASDIPLYPAWDPYVRTIMNADSFQTYGIEGELTYRPAQFDFIRLNFNFANGSGKSLHRFDETASEYRNLDETIPADTLGLLIAKKFLDLNWSLGLYHIGDVEWRSAGDNVDSYTRVDLSVSKQFKVDRNKNITLKLTAQNIGRSDYDEFRDGVEFEPRYFLTMALSKR